MRYKYKRRNKTKWRDASNDKRTSALAQYVETKSYSNTFWASVEWMHKQLQCRRKLLGADDGIILILCSKCTVYLAVRLEERLNNM